MGLLNLPRIPRGASPEQMANIYNTAIEEMEHRVNGFLQSNNIQEVGGWRVGQTELQSKDGDVGMSTADDGADPVRFFAGGSDKETAAFQVRQSGKATLTGARIVSRNGSYPYIELDPDDDLFGVYASLTEYIQMRARDTGSFTFPFFLFSFGSNSTYMFHNSSNFEITSDSPIKLNTFGEDITLTGGNVRVDSWADLIDASTAQTLATALNNLANAMATKGASTGSGGGTFLNGGIPIGTALATAGGGSVTWAGINVPSHSHTQN